MMLKIIRKIVQAIFVVTSLQHSALDVNLRSGVGANVKSDKLDDFLVSDHGHMLTDLNKISDDLLKAKWYFLATISAIGFGYKYILGNTTVGIPSMIPPFITMGTSLVSADKDFTDLGITGICLIGNIMFWLIGEYVLSHGFLFRYIQTRAAQIEKRFYYKRAGFEKLLNLCKDPSDPDNFVEDQRLKMDQFIPDQFVPIYWASIWMIVLNTAFAVCVKSYSTLESSLFIIASSLFLITKIWTYYILKLEKFSILYELGIQTRNGNIFKYPMILHYPGIIVGLVIFGFFYHIEICQNLSFIPDIRQSYSILFCNWDMIFGFIWSVFLGFNILPFFFGIIFQLLKYFCQLEPLYFQPAFANGQLPIGRLKQALLLLYIVV